MRAKRDDAGEIKRFGAVRLDLTTSGLVRRSVPFLTVLLPQGYRTWLPARRRIPGRSFARPGIIRARPICAQTATGDRLWAIIRRATLCTGACYPENPSGSAPL